MKSEFLETGEIVNTHGIQGEVKINPWSDSPAFLLNFSTLYVDGHPVKVDAARVHKNTVLAKLEGVDDVDTAMKLKGKCVFIARADAKLPEGCFFLSDAIGIAVEDENGKTIGAVKEILTPPAHNVYVVEGEGESHMIPAVDEFVKSIDIDGGKMVVQLIEGM